MVNNIENNKSLNGMSELEHNKNAVEMMRYRPNKLASSLTFGGILFSVLAAFICLNSMKPVDAQIILFVGFTIIVLLVGFLCSELVKSYSEKGSIVLIVIGALVGLNVLWIPKNLIDYYNMWISAKEELVTATGERADELNDIIDKCKNVLGATITSSTSENQIRWLTDNGTVRGVLAIICFVAATGFFVAAGVIGFIRARKLNAYLASINVKK